MDGQSIFIYVLIGLMVIGFVYFNFIFPKQSEKNQTDKEIDKNKKTKSSRKVLNPNR